MYIYLLYSSLLFTVLFKWTGSWKSHSYVCISISINEGDRFVNVGVCQKYVLQSYMVNVQIIILIFKYPLSYIHTISIIFCKLVILYSYDHISFYNTTSWRACDRMVNHLLQRYCMIFYYIFLFKKCNLPIYWRKQLL